MRKHTHEAIVAALQGIDRSLREGKSAADAVRAAGITAVTYYRWRRQYGGLTDDQAGLMTQLRVDNARLRRRAAELSLDRQILLEAVKRGLPTPALRRALVDQVKTELGVSERRACRVLGQHRSTQRKKPKSRNNHIDSGFSAMQSPGL